MTYSFRSGTSRLITGSRINGDERGFSLQRGELGKEHFVPWISETRERWRFLRSFHRDILRWIETNIFTMNEVQVSTEEECWNPNIVAGYVPGVSGIPYINQENCDNDMLQEHSYLSSASECARTCRQGEEPKTCYYKFVIERYPVNGKACSTCLPDSTNQICANCQCVPGDGVQRMALTVNRMIPGPSIQVCLGDEIVVDVQNKIKECGVTIHWHGIFQKGTQYFDGVPLVTQCPIMFQNSFRYQFAAGNSGTHFWHAHTGLHKMDGIFGSLIIREPIETEPNTDLYDFDLSNHIIVINDWMNEESTERYPGRETGVTGQSANSLLINGKGRTRDSKGKTTNSPLEIITVEANKRYRFRLINSFCAICPSMLTIENHDLIVIATDGQSLQPVMRNDSILSYIPINLLVSTGYNFVHLVLARIELSSN